MAVARSFREGWLTSLRIDALRDDAAELFLFRLGLRADKNGVYHGEPELLRAAVYPTQLPRRRLTDVARYRDKCAEAGLLRLWIAEDGRPYVQILKFRQKTPNEKAIHPVPPGDPDEDGQEQLALAPPDTAPPPERRKQNRKEGSGAAEPPPPAPESQEEWLARLRAQWPHVDIDAELIAAQAKRSQQKKRLERAWFERHWLPQCSQMVSFATAGSARPIPPEPEAWRLYLKDEYEGESWAETAAAYSWGDMPANFRERIAREMRGRKSA